MQTHFRDLPQVAPPPPEPSQYIGGEFREERDLDQVHVVLGFPSTGYKDRLHYPTLLLSTLLGGGMSSRLFQEIREKRGLVYSIYSFAHPFKDGGVFAVYAGTGEKEVEELMPVTLDELRKVQTTVTQDELDRAKAQLRASLLMSLESTGSRTEQLARQIQVHGRVIPVEETKAKIAAVTIEDVQEAASAPSPAPRPWRRWARRARCRRWPRSRRGWRHDPCGKPCRTWSPPPAGPGPMPRMRC